MSCEIHKRHSPRPTYFELHHVVPQSWQRVWQPPKPWPNGGRGDQGPLWDARTVSLCRTGHGNVHFWLVKLMHGQGTKGAVSTELVIANEAMTRFLEAGGDLQLLRDRREFGAI